MLELKLEIFLAKESPLAFLNSLKAFLKEKMEKGEINGYSISMSTETCYHILFFESIDNPETPAPVPTSDPCGDRLG